MTMRSAGGSSLSPCQTIRGALPVLRSSARYTSRSRLEPGKTTMAAFMASLGGGGGGGWRSDSPLPAADQGRRRASGAVVPLGGVEAFALRRVAIVADEAAGVEIDAQRAVEVGWVAAALLAEIVGPGFARRGLFRLVGRSEEL